MSASDLAMLACVLIFWLTIVVLGVLMIRDVARLLSQLPRNISRQWHEGKKEAEASKVEKFLREAKKS
jgi:predicted PurR-regulated permease PerM